MTHGTHNALDDPRNADVLASQNNDGETVVRDVILGPCDRGVLFLKQMTHHLVELDLGFLAQTVNVIFTRDPADMLPSYAQEVETPSLRDTGYPRHLELLEHLRFVLLRWVVITVPRTNFRPQGTCPLWTCPL